MFSRGIKRGCKFNIPRQAYFAIACVCRVVGNVVIIIDSPTIRTIGFNRVGGAWREVFKKKIFWVAIWVLNINNAADKN